MTRSLYRLVVTLLALITWAGICRAQAELNAAGDPRYGWHTLTPAFAPAPLTIDALSGGDIDVRSLGLGPNCLGFAASEPDFVIELSGEFDRVTFLIASAQDTTLIINLPNGSWSCDDDTNGLNPALVYYNALPGAYRLWVGSYAADKFEESVLHVSEAGPETLPTTATGPDPSRDPLYGETSLSPGFLPAPFAIQLTGGGRNRADDYIVGERCSGFVSEAPDFSVILRDEFARIWFAVYSPADMTLVVNAADGNWHCSDDHRDRNPALGFSYPLAGLYDIWVGSADEGNYAAAIFFAVEYEPDASLTFTIDTDCAGLPPTELQVGTLARVSQSAASSLNLYAVPETASTVLAQAAPGSSLALVGGPVCDEERRWWRADVSDVGPVWVADGYATTRWLEPQS